MDWDVKIKIAENGYILSFPQVDSEGKDIEVIEVCEARSNKEFSELFPFIVNPPPAISALYAVLFTLEGYLRIKESDVRFLITPKIMKENVNA